PVEADERHLPAHRGPQALVLSVGAIRSAIAVELQPLVVHLVLVRPLATLHERCRPDAERQAAEGGAEDALLAHEGHSPALVLEPLEEDTPWDRVRVRLALHREELECAHTNLGIDVRPYHARTARSPRG